MQITKFTTTQHNDALGTQNTITQNKLKQLKSPGLVTSYDLWPGSQQVYSQSKR